MTDIATEVGQQVLSEFIRQRSRGNGTSTRPTAASTDAAPPLKPPAAKVPAFMKAKDDFFFIFKWAKVTEESIAYALVLIFIFTVIATIVMQILRQYEQEVLARRQSQITPGLRLGAAFAFTIRMGFIYIFVAAMLSQNLWVYMTLLGGHFVGWVIFSGINGQSTEAAHMQQTLSLAALKEQQKRKEKKFNDDNSSQADSSMDNV